LVKTTGDVTGDVFTVTRPDADNMAAVLVTGPAIIPQNGAGVCSADWPLPVKYAGAAPSVGDERGTAANSFELTAGKTGFKVIAVDSGNGLAWIMPAGGGGSADDGWETGDLKPRAANTDHTVNGHEWLKCDGRALSRTTYADLFLFIGTAFGIGDGSTTFNIPDLRAYYVGPSSYYPRFLSGPINGVIGGVGNDYTHTHTGPSHGHTVTVDAVGNHTHTATPGNNFYRGASPDAALVANGNHTHTAATGSGGTGATGVCSTSKGHTPVYVSAGWFILASKT
jgi:microcystin-dependent protein